MLHYKHIKDLSHAQIADILDTYEGELRGYVDGSGSKKTYLDLLRGSVGINWTRLLQWYSAKDVAAAAYADPDWAVSGKHTHLLLEALKREYVVLPLSLLLRVVPLTLNAAALDFAVIKAVVAAEVEEFTPQVLEALLDAKFIYTDAVSQKMKTVCALSKDPSARYIAEAMVAMDNLMGHEIPALSSLYPDVLATVLCNSRYMIRGFTSILSERVIAEMVSKDISVVMVSVPPISGKSLLRFDSILAQSKRAKYSVNTRLYNYIFGRMSEKRITETFPKEALPLYAYLSKFRT